MSRTEARALMPMKPSQATREECERAVELFRIMGHEVRLQVLVLLVTAERLTVSELIAQVGCEQSALSHQLRALRQARLVNSRKMGRFIYYELYDQHVSALVNDAIAHVREEEREPSKDKHSVRVKNHSAARP